MSSVDPRCWKWPHFIRKFLCMTVVPLCRTTTKVIAVFISRSTRLAHNGGARLPASLADHPRTRQHNLSQNHHPYRPSIALVCAIRACRGQGRQGCGMTFALTGRRDPEAREECWHIYFGDVRAGSFTRATACAASRRFGIGIAASIPVHAPANSRAVRPRLSTRWHISQHGTYRSASHGTSAPVSQTARYKSDL